MKAVIFEKIGGPEVIRVVNVEAKHPGPGKVRVKMEASGLNYSDLLIRTGQYPDPFRAPYYVGREIAGAIDAVGEGVGSFSIGQKVFGMVAEGGTMAELPAVPRTRPFSVAGTVAARRGRIRSRTGACGYAVSG